MAEHALRKYRRLALRKLHVLYNSYKMRSVRDSKMCLGIFGQWSLLTFAVLGLSVLIDVAFSGKVAATAVLKELGSSAVFSTLFIWFWNVAHALKSERDATGS